MTIQDGIRKTLRILFILSIVPSTVEAVCDKKNLLTFTANSVVYIKAESQFCFDDKNIVLKKVYTEVGYIEDEEILKSIICSDISHSCFYAPESFEVIVLYDITSKNLMIVINEVSKMDYQGGNTHIKSRYLPNEIECFHVSNTLKNTVIPDLKSFANFYFINSDERLHCVIFDGSEKAVKKIRFDSEEVTINYESQYVGSLFRPHSRILECTSFKPTNATFIDSIDILKLDAQKYCIDGRTNELDLFKDVPNFKYKRETECYINSDGKQKSCLFVYTDVFRSGVFRSPKNSRKTLLFHPYSSVYVKRIEFKKLRSTYSLNDRFCVDPDIYTSKRHLLRGYYNKKNQTHCFVAKEVAGTTKIEVQKDSVKKTITFKGCPVDVTKPITTNFPILLNDGDNKFCMNKDYVFIDDALSTTDYVELLNLQDKDNCWIDLPAKRCYSIGDSTDYMLLVNKERTVNVFVSKKKATVNSQISTDFLYQAEYGKYLLICIPNSILVNYDNLKNEAYVNTDSTKLCISVSLIHNDEEDKFKIELMNSAGCPTRTLNLNPNNYAIEIEELEVKECTPFHRKSSGSKDVIKLTSNDLHEKCLILTCTEIVWTLNLKSATSNSDILSTKVVICNVKPSKNCIDLNNPELSLYKTYNDILKQSILVVTIDLLPNLIFENYQRFYLPFYGKDDVVCFIKAKIKEFVVEKFKLKDSKYACAIVGELNSDVTIKFNNIADCEQEVKLLHNSFAPSDKEFDPQSCLFLLKKETYNILTVKDEVINRCQPLTCSEVTYIIEGSDFNIRETQKIVDCASPLNWNECHTNGSELILFKIKNKFIPYGKFIYRDVKFSLSQNFFYVPIYDNTDMVCFAKTKVENIYKMDENHVFSKDDNFCIFPRDIKEDITVNVKINQFCKRQIAFKASNVASNQPDWFSSCGIFTETANDSNMASVLKYDDVTQCLINMCIEFEYMMNKGNEVINCNEKNCYTHDSKEMTYIKLKSQYNRRTFYVMSTNIYTKLDSESTINTFYLSGYFKNEMVCVPDAILQDSKKELTKGVATLQDHKTCYFTKDLDNTHEFSVKLQGKFIKTLKLYTEERTNARMAEIIKNDEKCMIFVENLANIQEILKINFKDVQKCADLAFFKVSYAVQKPQNLTDLQTIMQKCSVDDDDDDDDDDRCHILLKNFEYAQIVGIYSSTPIYVQSSDSRNIFIPEGYFYDTAYFSNEVVCLNSKVIKNPSDFDFTNSYKINNNTCIIPGALSTQKILLIKTSGDCVRSINLHHNQARTINRKSHDIDEKCTPFLVKKRMVKVLSSSEIKKCLGQTCSKVISAVKITNKKEQLISSKIMNCSPNDYSGSCLKDDNDDDDDDDEYDFIEVINDYVDGPIYFRTFENQETTEDNKEQKLPMYYKQFYSSDNVVCFKKDLLKDHQAFSKLDGVFVENHRTCSLTNKLKANFDVKYKINDNCDLDVKLKSSFASKVSPDEVDISVCEKFIPGGSQNRDVLKMTTDELTMCLTKTCSKVNQVVYNSKKADGSLQKNVQSCQTESDMKTCLKAVDSADALEIVTPFRTFKFYVSTKDSIDVPPSATYYYQDQYYSGDIVCFEKSIISTKVFQLSNHGIIDYGNNICFVVKDLSQDIDLAIKQFNKCPKTIKMKHSTSSKSLESSHDLCTPFYTPKSGIQTFTKAGLKSCLSKTCSQLKYTVTDINNKNQLEKTITSYTSDYGVHPEVSEDAKFYFAKVINPALVSAIYIYIYRRLITSEDQLYSENYFYESEYGPESVICFQSSHIKNNFTNIITFPFGKHTCIVILELEVTIDLSLSNPLCQRTIRLNPNKPNSISSYLQNDIDCAAFLQTPDSVTRVVTVTMDLLPKCLSHTCSKVQGLVDIGDISKPQVLHKYLNCDQIPNEDKCLDYTKEYDYIKIENPFLTSPIYFRTKEIPLVKITPPKSAVFYNSTYFDNDVVCFAKNEVVIPDEQKNQNGIFVSPTQTCIITKELSSDIKIQHKISTLCKINVFFSRKNSPKQEKVDRDLEKKCSKFLNIATESPVILNIPSSDILECMTRTCSKIDQITSMGSLSTSARVKTCEVKKKDEECLAEALYTDTLLISSPFVGSIINIRKSDNDSTLLSSASVPSYYEVVYFADQVLCIKESELVDSARVKALKETHIVNGNVCIIVKNLEKDSTINVKQFGKCQKTIVLKYQTRKESDTSNDNECSDFYSMSGVSHKHMTFDSLKNCIQSTCSNIEYFVPKAPGNESPIFEMVMCEKKPGTTECFGVNTEIYFAKISSEAKDGFLTITTDTVNSIDKLKYEKFYHHESLLKNQIMCVKKNKLVEADSYDKTKSFETKEYKCLVGLELETNKVIKILTSTKKGCQRQINVVSNSTRRKDTRTCSTFIRSSGDSSSVHSISMSDLQLCLTKTCSKVFSAVKLIPSQPLIQSKLINCEKRYACLNSDIYIYIYDFIKIKNDYLTGHVYFRTFDPLTINTSYLPEFPFLYKNSFYKNDVVCFMKSKFPSQDFASPTSGIFVEADRICVIVSEISTSISVNYPISDTCNHKINMNNTQEPDNYKDKSEDMKLTCPLFFLESPPKLDLPSMSKQTLIECIKYTCSEISTFISLTNANEVYSSRKLQSCTPHDTCLQNINHFENLKIQSPYRNSNFTLSSQDAKTSSSDVSKKTQYVDSYRGNDVVCIHDDLFNDSRNVLTLPSVFKKHDAYCLVASDLYPNTEVVIKQYGKCQKIIKFNPSPPIAESQSCKPFYTSTISIPNLMEYSQLRKCIEDTCSKIEYFTFDEDTDDKRNRKLHECYDVYGVTECIKNVRKYQIFKISNPSLDTPIIVKLDTALPSIPITSSSVSAENDETSKTESYFYKTDYFQDDILCVPTTSASLNSDITSLNSYSIGTETCIIIKDLSQSTSLTLSSSGCSQTINLHPKDSVDQMKSANSLYHLCEKFHKPSESQIYPMSLLNLKKCLAHTCSSVVGYREQKSSNSHSMIGKISICSSSQKDQNCLTHDKFYDFIQVKSGFLIKNVHFTTIETATMESVDSHLSGYYESNYYNDDVVCFLTKKIIKPSNFDLLKGVLVKEDKTCFVVKDLVSMILLEYQITDTCSKNISLDPELSPNKLIDSARTDCSHFITDYKLTENLPKYSKDQLLNCMSRTCSRIASFVESDTSSVSNKIKTCDSSISPNDCLGDVRLFEALEVKSPSVTDTFYVQSDSLTQAPTSIFMKTNYNDSYYNDEIVCVHKDVIKNKGSRIEMKVIYKNGDVNCFIVKESSEGDTFTVKIHGHCDKTIQLVKSHSSSVRKKSKLQTQCRKFYTITNDYEKMSYIQLAECVKYTCSKVDYYVTNLPSGNSAAQRIEDCTTLFGDTSCMDSENPPYLVKITNPITQSALYIINYQRVDIDAKILGNTFLKPEYNINYIICFKSSMLASNHHNLAIPFPQNDIKCIVVKDLSTDQNITFTMKDGCVKEISLKKTTSENSDGMNVKDCSEFLTDPVGNPSVTTTSIQKLISCIQVTCSKVESSLEVKTNDLMSISSSLNECKQIHGNPQCLNTTKMYDFVKLKNSFLSKPLILRTFDQRTNVVPTKDFPLYYSSVYAGDHVVCFNRSQVLDSPQLNNEWIYHESDRICVLVSDVTSNTKVNLQIGESYSRTIIFVPTSQSEYYNDLRSNDKLCQKFYSKGNTIIPISFDNLEICLQLTGLTIENEEIRNIYADCSSIEEDTCKVQFKSIRIPIRSLYRKDQLLVISPETSTQLENLIEDPSRYSLIYTRNEIPCFASSTIPETSKNMITYLDVERNTFCMKTEKDHKEEYLVKIDKNVKSQVSIMDSHAIRTLLQSAYLVNLEIYTFESEKKLVSKGVSASFHFTVQEDDVYKTYTEFTSCVLSAETKEPIVSSNYSSFIQGYLATIPKNNIFIRPLSIYVNRKKACIGYMENTNSIDTESNHKSKKLTKSAYECLPVLNGYLAFRFNAKVDNLNVTEKLDGECLIESQIKIICEHTHQFSDHITICYGKGKSVEKQDQTDPSNRIDETILLDIRVLLKNGDCYTEKAVLSQRVGFCEIKDGFVQMSLFSYDSFTRTMVRHEMISTSYESSFLLVFILAFGLFISGMLMKFNKLTVENEIFSFMPPLTLSDT